MTSKLKASFILQFCVASYFRHRRPRRFLSVVPGHHHYQAKDESKEAPKVIDALSSSASPCTRPTLPSGRVRRMHLSEEGVYLE